MVRQFIGVRDAQAWEGDLTVAAGILGDGAAYSLATGVTTQRGRLRATLDERGLEAQASGRVLEGFELGGRYQRTEVGELGLASAELAATPALRVGVTGSSDQGLTFGGFLRHLGDPAGPRRARGREQRAVGGKGTSRLLVQGSAIFIDVLEVEQQLETDVTPPEDVGVVEQVGTSFAILAVQVGDDAEGLKEITVALKDGPRDTVLRLGFTVRHEGG